EYLITLFEEYFKKIDTSYPTSFKDILRYRKRFKSFFNSQWEVNKSIKRSAKLAQRIVDNTNKTLRNIEKGKDVEKYSEELNEITSQFETETKFINNHKF